MHKERLSVDREQERVERKPLSFPNEPHFEDKPPLRLDTKRLPRTNVSLLANRGTKRVTQARPLVDHEPLVVTHAPLLQAKEPLSRTFGRLPSNT